jgi:hypothetical protein
MTNANSPTAEPRNLDGQEADHRPHSQQHKTLNKHQAKTWQANNRSPTPAANKYNCLASGIIAKP